MLVLLKPFAEAYAIIIIIQLVMAHNIFISTVSDAHNYYYYYYAWACWWMPMLGGCRKYNPVIRFE